MRRKKKSSSKICINDLLDLTECETEMEFIQVVGGGLTDSVKPVWSTVKGVSEYNYYALNYPFLKILCPDVRGDMEVLEGERIQ